MHYDPARDRWEAAWPQTQRPSPPAPASQSQPAVVSQSPLVRWKSVRVVKQFDFLFLARLAGLVVVTESLENLSVSATRSLDCLTLCFRRLLFV